MANDDDSTLTDEQKTRIETTFASLATCTHYELLGIPTNADKKAVKRAYYALTAEFHSDKHYGKNLGRHRAMLDAIVARVTMAHDVLTTTTERADYDLSIGIAPPPPLPERLHSGVRPAVSAADIEARKQALARRLVGGGRIITTPGMPAVRPPIDPKKKPPT
jgi:curved DNA-binding protein CbpA